MNLNINVNVKHEKKLHLLIKYLHCWERCAGAVITPRRILRLRPPMESAGKGICPVVIKNNNTPRAHMSTGPPMYEASRNSSGAAYGGDPQKVLSNSSGPVI